MAGKTKKHVAAFTLMELILIFVVFVILVGLLLPVLFRAREEARRSSCISNLGQLGKAQNAYMVTNGDFWSFKHDQRDFAGQNPARGYREKYHNSNISLSLLFPRWVDDVNVFQCNSTEDRPIIGRRLVPKTGMYSWFFSHHTGNYEGGLDGAGYHIQAYANQEEVPKDITVTGFLSNRQHGPSFGYDDQKHYRAMYPGSARMADMRWLDSAGRERSNHGLDGQNVLYWDGHVAFRDTVYASADPQDNIFVRSWDPRERAFRNEIEQDAVIVRTHRDGLVGSGLELGREWW